MATLAMTRGDTVALRDRMLMVLRDAEEPLSTAEACERAGRYLEQREHRPWMHEVHFEAGGGGYVELLSCDGDTDLLSMALNATSRGYQILRWLEAHGHATKLRMADHRSVMWVHRGGSVDREIRQLERIWKLPPLDPSPDGL